MTKGHFEENSQTVAYTIHRQRQIFDIFLKKISEFFHKILMRISKLMKFEHIVLFGKKQSMFMQNFSSLAFTQTDFFDLLTKQNVEVFGKPCFLKI
jgi:hypothetical protein